MHIIVPFLDTLALLQGIIIGLIIIFLGKKQYAPLFFGLFLITYAVELGDNILQDFNIIKAHPILEFLPFSFYFLNIPLLFLYVEAIVGRFKWKTHIYWLLPGIFEFAFFTTVSIFFSQISVEVREEIAYFRGYLTVLWYIIFPIFIFIRVRSYQKQLDITHTNPITSNLRWVMYLCIALIVISAPLILESLEAPSSWMVYAVLSVINVAFIYVIGMMGLRQQYVELEGIGDEEHGYTLDIDYVEDTVHHQSNAHPSLPASAADAIEVPKTIVSAIEMPKENTLELKLFERIDQKIIENELFLDSELTLFKVSRAVGIQSRRMSEIIHSETGTYFKAYINEKRLAFAKSMLLNPKYQEYTMEAIAYDSGFHTKSTFFSLFKSTEGLTPAQYRDQHLEQKRES